MLAIIAKVLLLAFIVIALVVVVVVYRRRSRRSPNTGFRSNSHLAQVYGAMPETPLPDWAKASEYADGEESPTPKSG